MSWATSTPLYVSTKWRGSRNGGEYDVGFVLGSAIVFQLAGSLHIVDRMLRR
jgi:hypothetical protein